MIQNSILIRDIILSLTNEGLAVFRHYIRSGWKSNKPFYNPLYNDTNPDCYIRKDSDGRYRLHDFGSEEHSGDCFFYVGALNGMDSNNNVDFDKILRIIDNDLALGCYKQSYDVKPIKRRPRKTNNTNVVQQKEPIESIAKVIDEEKEEIYIPIEYTIKQRDFSDQELTFWGEYGITIETLNRFNVVALEEYSSISKEGVPYTLRSSSYSPIYGYLHEKFIKLYRPNDPKYRFSYGGDTRAILCFGLEQLPQKGDVLYITSGEKDVMSLAARGFNAICFNSETSDIPTELMCKFSYMFKHIVVLFNMDETGLKRSLALKNMFAEFGIIRLLLPLPGSKGTKDISDYFKLGHSAHNFRMLLLEILNTTYKETITFLKSCEINFKIPPPMSQNIITVNSVPLGAAGNLMCITGGEGTGKSNFVGAVIAGSICNEDAEIDTLGVTISPNSKGMVTILYDTEQSDSQLFKNCVNILRRANLESMPSNFKAYSLTGMSRGSRLKSIIESMDHIHHTYNGIHMVVIDGVADLIRSANDESESISIVEELYRLAGMYNTCIICVLHFIPSGLKLRGHLGAELQRKAAGIISIEKESNTDVSVMKAIKVRDGNPLDAPILQFSWNKEVGMHCYLGEKSAEDRRTRKEEELKEIAIKIFSDKSRVTYTELQHEIEEKMNVKDRAAKSNIKFMRDRGLVVNIINDDESEPQYIQMGSFNQ